MESNASVSFHCSHCRIAVTKYQLDYRRLHMLGSDNLHPLPWHMSRNHFTCLILFDFWISLCVFWLYHDWHNCPQLIFLSLKVPITFHGHASFPLIRGLFPSGSVWKITSKLSCQCMEHTLRWAAHSLYANNAALVWALKLRLRHSTFSYELLHTTAVLP